MEGEDAAWDLVEGLAERVQAGGLLAMVGRVVENLLKTRLVTGLESDRERRIGPVVDGRVRRDDRGDTARRENLPDRRWQRGRAAAGGPARPQGGASRGRARYGRERRRARAVSEQERESNNYRGPGSQAHPRSAAMCIGHANEVRSWASTELGVARRSLSTRGCRARLRPTRSDAENGRSGEQRRAGRSALRIVATVWGL